MLAKLYRLSQLRVLQQQAVAIPVRQVATTAQFKTKQHIAAHSTPSSDLKKSATEADLASAVYAMAVQNKREPKTLAGLLDRAYGDAHTFTPPQMARLALGMAMLGVVHKPLLRRISDSVTAHADELDPQDTATLAWSMAALQAYDRQVFAALAKRGAYAMDSMSLQASAKMVSAFADCGDFDRGLFVAVVKRTRRFVNDYRPQDLAMTTAALSKAGKPITGGEIFKTIAAAVKSRLGDFSTRDLCVVAEALSKQGQADAPLGESIRKLMSERWSSLSDSDKAQAQRLMKLLSIQHMQDN